MTRSPSWRPGRAASPARRIRAPAGTELLLNAYKEPRAQSSRNQRAPLLLETQVSRTPGSLEHWDLGWAPLP
jgi:hypothetical protein